MTIYRRTMEISNKELSNGQWEIFNKKNIEFIALALRSDKWTSIDNLSKDIGLYRKAHKEPEITQEEIIVALESLILHDMAECKESE